MPGVERVDRPNLRTRALPEPDCRGRAPEFDVGAGSDCGHLTVAENRERPSGRTIRIPVARLRAQSPNPKPDPIVFLAGGPGEFVSHVRTSSVALGLTSTGIEQRLVSGRRGGPVLVEAPDLIGVEQLAAEFKSRDVVNGYFDGQVNSWRCLTNTTRNPLRNISHCESVCATAQSDYPAEGPG